MVQTVKILLADDNDELRMLYRIMLSEFTVIQAVNGNEAVAFYKKHKPDLVLMDILMPIKDGIEATKEIIEFDPKATIIAITAYSSKAENILLAGAKQVIKKPFRRIELIEIIVQELQ